MDSSSSSKQLYLAVYADTALAALDSTSVHPHLFANKEYFPKTAAHFQGLVRCLARPNSTLSDYVADETHVKNIREKFDSAVADIPHSSHVIANGVVDWAPVRDETFRHLDSLRLETALCVQTLLEEVENDIDGIRRPFLQAQRAGKDVVLVLDNEGKHKLDSLTLLEIISGLNDSIFRVKRGDRRFNYVGVRRRDTAQCMLLESAVMGLAARSLLIDGQGGEQPAVLFPWSVAFPAMLDQLERIEALAVRTAGVRIL